VITITGENMYIRRRKLDNILRQIKNELYPPNKFTSQDFYIVRGKDCFIILPIFDMWKPLTKKYQIVYNKPFPISNK